MDLIPKEIWLEITRYLDQVKHVVNLSKTCRFFNQLTRSHEKMKFLEFLFDAKNKVKVFGLVGLIIAFREKTEFRVNYKDTFYEDGVPKESSLWLIVDSDYKFGNRLPKNRFMSVRSAYFNPIENRVMHNEFRKKALEAGGIDINVGVIVERKMFIKHFYYFFIEKLNKKESMFIMEPPIVRKERFREKSDLIIQDLPIETYKNIFSLKEYELYTNIPTIKSSSPQFYIANIPYRDCDNRLLTFDLEHLRNVLKKSDFTETVEWLYKEMVQHNEDLKLW